MKLKRVLQTTFAAVFLCATAAGAWLLSSTPAKATTATAEWAAGNASVSATFNFDVTNSDYGETGDNPGYWRIRLVDSNTLTSYNTALKNEGFFYKTSYLNMKSLFYESVANASDPSLNLGYYDGDFKMAFTPVQSIVANTYSAGTNLDYYGVVYTFTDTATGNYFQIRMRNAGNIAKNAIIEASVNGGAFSAEVNTTGSFGGRHNGTAGSPDSGIFYLFNIKYDRENNVIKYFRDLSQSISLSDLGLTSALDTYKVDMEFYNVQAGKTAKMCVYYLNGYDLTAEPDNDITSNGSLVYQKLSEYSLTTSTIMDATDLAGAWDAAVGDVSSDIEFEITDPAGNDVINKCR